MYFGPKPFKIRVTNAIATMMTAVKSKPIYMLVSLKLAPVVSVIVTGAVDTGLVAEAEVAVLPELEVGV